MAERSETGANVLTVAHPDVTAKLRRLVPEVFNELSSLKDSECVTRPSAERSRFALVRFEQHRDPNYTFIQQRYMLRAAVLRKQFVYSLS